MLRDGPKRRMREPELREITDADHEDEGGDHGFERAETVALEREDGEGDDARDDRGRKERHSEQEMDPHGRSQELSEVGRHSDQLGLDPESDRRALRESLP